MGINFIDQSGTPRSDEDLQEAIQAVGKEMIAMTPGNPELMVMFPTIIDCLRELQTVRAVIREHNNRK